MSARPNLWHDEYEWRKHDGKACPVHPDTECLFGYRCKQVSPKPDFARNRIWPHRGWDFDIVAFKVLKIAEGLA